MLSSQALWRCAVLGSPVAHSLSPVLHRAAYAALGLSGWSYEAYEVDEPELAGTVAALDGSWRGLSLTMPLKRAAIRMCDTVTPLAREVAAVNTIVFSPEGVAGSNTDVPGVAAALRERGVLELDAAAILGFGATAGSALAGLAEVGVRRVTAYGRDPRKAEPMADLARARGVSLEIVPWDEAARLPVVDVAVSTVPAEVAAPLAETVATRAPAVFDVLYDPWPTPLAAAASNAGRALIGGLDLLLHQAAMQVEVMTGRSPAPLDAMRSAGEAALRQRRASR